MNLLRHRKKFKNEFERDQHFNKIIGNQNSSAEVVNIRERGYVDGQVTETYEYIGDKIIYEFETDINVSFHIWALYKTDPGIYIPDKWMKRIEDIIEIEYIIVR